MNATGKLVNNSYEDQGSNIGPGSIYVIEIET
jgi:hypothetical protein